MLFKNPHRLLVEAAADLLDPKVSPEAKEAIDGLEDALVDPNIEEVKEEEQTTNGGVPETIASAKVMESANKYGKNGAKYLISLEEFVTLLENEGEAAAEEKAIEDAEPGEAPAEVTPEDAEAAEPEPENLVEKIADDIGVESKDIAIVVSMKECSFIAQCAINEAACGCKSREATKRLIKKNAVLKGLREAGVTIVKIK